MALAYGYIILHEVEYDPSTSDRPIEQRMGIPYTTLYRILERHEYITGTTCNVYKACCLRLLLCRRTIGEIQNSLNGILSLH